MYPTTRPLTMGTKLCESLKSSLLKYPPRFQPRDREQVALELRRAASRRRHVRQPREDLGHHATRADPSRRSAAKKGREDTMQ